jgi:hypothetical protein
VISENRSQTHKERRVINSTNSFRAWVAGRREPSAHFRRYLRALFAAYALIAAWRGFSGRIRVPVGLADLSLVALALRAWFAKPGSRWIVVGRYAASTLQKPASTGSVGQMLYRDEHREAGIALDERGDVRVVRPGRNGNARATLLCVRYTVRFGSTLNFYVASAIFKSSTITLRRVEIDSSTRLCPIWRRPGRQSHHGLAQSRYSKRRPPDRETERLAVRKCLAGLLEPEIHLETSKPVDVLTSFQASASSKRARSFLRALTGVLAQQKTKWRFFGSCQLNDRQGCLERIAGLLAVIVPLEPHRLSDGCIVGGIAFFKLCGLTSGVRSEAPGSTIVTLIPNGPTSRESTSEKPSTPPFCSGVRTPARRANAAAMSPLGLGSVETLCRKCRSVAVWLDGVEEPFSGLARPSSRP